jgi:iron complex outermembrane recepter protein
MNCHANRSAAGGILASLFACISLCWMAPLAAQENSRQHDIDIPPSPLGQALQLFSEQTKLQYGYLPTDDEEEQLMVGPVKGRFTADEILLKLLPDGFTFAWTNPRTISIVSPPENAPPGGVKDAVAAKDEKRLELSKGQRLSMTNGTKSGSMRDPYDFDWKITVEASRISDFDVPMVVFDRQQIDASGVSTLADLMRYVPQQVHVTRSPLGDGSQFADLRGLGFDTTLVLINGRRVTPTASALTANAFDLNSIPLGMVESIQVVSDSMSAPYGADAIGGVLNIILRDDIPEPKLDVDYGAASGGGVERHAALGASGSMGRARGTLVLDYFDRSPLLGRDRDRWNNQDFRRFGSVDWRSPVALPGNVSSSSGQNLPNLPSEYAVIPTLEDDALPTVADFLPTAGRRHLDSLYKYQSVTPDGRRKGVAARGEYSFAPKSSVFGEFLYVDREVSLEMEPAALAGAPVSALNPYNPFGVDVSVDTLIAGLGPRRFSRRAEMTRAVAGARGQVREWEWELSLQKMQDDDTSVRSNDLDPTRVMAALNATDRDAALNLFGANEPHLLGSLLAPPVRSTFYTAGTQATATFRGSLGSLPAGPLAVTTGGEWREERIRYRIAQPADLSSSDTRRVSAIFGVLRIPLISASAGVPLVQDLSLVLSGRFDDYSDIGGSYKPEYALSWKPLPGLSFRTSLSRSFRPPPLFDLHLPIIDLQVPTADTARDDEVALPMWRAGGNPHLRPTTAKSLAAGIEFQSSHSSALRVAANYWRVHMTDAIGIPSATRLLAAEDRFADRIARGPPTSGDIAADRPGPLERIDVTRLNFGSVKTSGVDISASLVVNTSLGQFLPSLSATYVRDFVTSDLVNGPDVSRTDVANSQGSIPRWRAVTGFDWRRGGFGASATLRYIHSYDDVDLLGNRNGRRVDSQQLVDVQLSADLGSIIGKTPLWQGIDVRVGIHNLLNAEQPFSEMAGLTGFDTSQGDLTERFGYVKLSKKF